MNLVHTKRVVSFLLFSFVFSFFSFFSSFASAGLFSVTPVRVYMTPKDRAVALTVTNDGDEELVMQAEVFDWKQKPDGEDVLTPTEDLLVSPPIFKIAPKSRQVVRMAKLVQPKLDAQSSYRMVLREVPEAKSQAKNINIQIAFAFSIPVFVTPPNAKFSLDCDVTRLAQDKVQANCANSGVAFLQPRHVVLSASNGVKLAESEGFAYMLPGVKRGYELKRSDGAIPSGSAKLAVSLDDGTTLSFNVLIKD